MNPEADKWSRVQIYGREDEVDCRGFELVSGYAVFAYPEELNPGGVEDDYMDDAREIAARRVANSFGITPQKALEEFEICIVPAFGRKGQGKVMFRRKGLNKVAQGVK